MRTVSSFLTLPAAFVLLPLLASPPQLLVQLLTAAVPCAFTDRRPGRPPG